MVKETYIGRGRAGKIYKIEDSFPPRARKEFTPSRSAKLWNWFFYNSPHPYSTEIGTLLAYWRRRLAHRVAKYVDPEILICDASEITEMGFIMPFVKGHQPSKRESHVFFHIIKRLEDRFDEIGLPTWSFSQGNPFARSNFILDGKHIHIIDYEQSVPIPDARGHMGYDEIYFGDLHHFLNEHKTKILDALGKKESDELLEAFSRCEEFRGKMDVRPRGLARFEEKFSKPLSKKEIEKTVERLHFEGKIDSYELEAFEGGTTGENIKSAIVHLAVHSVIGLTTPAYVMTLLSAILRPLWTIMNWFLCTFRGEYERRKIHSLRVILVSALPLPFPLSGISNGAYLLSIIEESPQIGLAMNDNLLREFTGKSLHDTMAGIGKKRILRNMVRGYNAFSHWRPIFWLQEKCMGKNTKKAHDVLLGYLMIGAQN